MRKPGGTILLIVLIFSFGCDPNQGSFEESIPGMHTLTTQVSPDQAGTIHPSGGEFASSDEIQIEARPAEGYVFDHWEGDLTGNSNPATIQFNSSKSLTAHFSPRDFNLNIETIGEGYVIESVVERSSTVTVELTAIAEDGWFFDRWEGDLTGDTNPETITIEEDEEKNITAVFGEEDSKEFTITANVEGEGSIEVDPDKNTYEQGEEVTLTAVAATGWNFIEWQGDLSGSERSHTVEMDANIDVTAIFEEKETSGLISIQEVKLFIKELELEGGRKTKDFKIKSFIENLPLDGSPFTITQTEIPAGIYEEFELEIEKPKRKDDVDDPDFRDETGSYSLVVRGTFSGAEFRFRSTEDFEIDVDLNPLLEITEGQNSIIVIDVDVVSWFKDATGEILDPKNFQNTEKINDNIEKSFEKFEDEFEND